MPSVRLRDFPKSAPFSGQGNYISQKPDLLGEIKSELEGIFLELKLTSHGQVGAVSLLMILCKLPNKSWSI